MTDTLLRTDEDADRLAAPHSSRSLRVVLFAIIAVALLVVAGAVGALIRGGSDAGAQRASSVDAGFAQDMSTHHEQAVAMANYERDHTTDSALRILAYDIETEQQYQVGQMQGWLQLWGLPNANAHAMSWMGSAHMHMQADGLMPGMATPAQMTTLQSSTGKALDILFLQLMIHHHQGGLPMARYAMTHASSGPVRTLAAQMVAAQSGEIIQMEQLLRQLGSSPLPPPAN